jgi:hypothetical protein
MLCASCGQPMSRRSTSLPEGQARHRGCREAERDSAKYLGRFSHGQSAYQEGCRCGVCAAAKASRLKLTRAGAKRK